MAKRGGFPGGMPGNMNNLMKQAQKMQRQMEEAQKELEEKEVTAAAGGGAVEFITAPVWRSRCTGAVLFYGTAALAGKYRLLIRQCHETRATCVGAHGAQSFALNTSSAG